MADSVSQCASDDWTELCDWTEVPFSGRVSCAAWNVRKSARHLASNGICNKRL